LATIYDLKPRFQALLRPLSDALVRAKLSANDVTLGALLLSAVHGAWLALMPGSAWPLLLLPVTLFVRMAMNAIDGMMAKEHGQASAEGAVLNELSGEGIGHLAKARPKVPVLPVFMHGLGKALPRGSSLLVPFNVIVSVGEPIYGKESYDAFVSQLEAAMKALAAQEKLPVWE